MTLKNVNNKIFINEDIFFDLEDILYIKYNNESLNLIIHYQNLEETFEIKINDYIFNSIYKILLKNSKHIKIENINNNNIIINTKYLLNIQRINENKPTRNIIFSKSIIRILLKSSYHNFLEIKLNTKDYKNILKQIYDINQFKINIIN